jgi:hypothetical protein
MAASDGGIFAFGDAGFFGSTGSIKLAKRIQQMASTPSGKGYWMVAGDGGIFAFGDAGFFGSAADATNEKRIVDIAPSATGKGYYITATNGAVYSYGDAKNYGGLEATKLARGIISMVALNNGEPPVASDDTISLDEDTTGSVDVLANDRDPDGGPLAIGGVSQPLRGGSATANGGTITYRPAPDINGSDSFTYTLVDDRGNTALATVTVKIRPVDDLPSAVDDTAAGFEDVPFVINVLGNDSGLGDGIGSLTVLLQPQPKYGTVTVAGANLLYTPKPNVNTDGKAPDTFAYLLVDKDGDNARGTVTVTLAAVNDVPLANHDQFTLTKNQNAGSVLDNDNPGENPRVKLLDTSGTPVDGPVLNPGGGSFDVNSKNQVVFTVDNFRGSQAMVSYVIVDDNNGAAPPETSNVASASFSLPNDAPTAGNPAASGTEGQPIGGDLVGADRETPDSQLTFRFVEAGAPSLNGRTWSWTAGPGDYVFHYLVNDGTQDSEQGTLSIHIAPASPPPAP